MTKFVQVKKSKKLKPPPTFIGLAYYYQGKARILLCLDSL